MIRKKLNPSGLNFQSTLWAIFAAEDLLLPALRSSAYVCFARRVLSPLGAIKYPLLPFTTLDDGKPALLALFNACAFDSGMALYPKVF